MTAQTQLALLISLFAAASVLDHLWLTHLRPRLSRRYGWRTVRTDERIPACAWIVASLFVFTLFVLLPATVRALGIQ
ncbi:hypothetical protein ACVTTK_07920 [Alcaligenes nematophilus]